MNQDLKINKPLSKFVIRRYSNTLSFVKKYAKPSDKILDLGVKNDFSEIMQLHGFQTNNTSGENLDDNYSAVNTENYDVITAFEIFEHLLAPYNILKNIKCRKLIASVPLKLWFANAFWDKNDKWNCHYHEFEPQQFDMLLERTGWKIIDSQKWTAPTNEIGFRPILRYFVPRYYIVYCERM